jgi:hypothetical protein
MPSIVDGSRAAPGWKPIAAMAPAFRIALLEGLLEPPLETNAIPQGQKTTITLLTEAPVQDVYTFEVVTFRLAEPRTMTGVQNRLVLCQWHPSA